jgi:hypothetical protein
MIPGDEGLVYASVSYELGSVFLTTLRPVVSFGRLAECGVRFGHQPVVDPGVPRVAGQLLVVGAGRVAVENVGERLAFDVVCEDSPLEAVRPGALFSPPGDRFEIQLTGRQQQYVIAVTVLSAPVRVSVRPPVSDPSEPVTSLDPNLTTRQWRILEAYTAPLRAGHPVSATHNQVADLLGWSMGLIRLECSEIWNQFVLAGVPMRDFPDKRDAVVDGAIRHRLLPSART